MILVNPSFELEKGLSEVFFSSILSCNHHPETHGILSIKHQQGPENVPPPFLMDYLRYGGVLIQEG